MKWFSSFRLATYLLIVFCAGHTLGGMLGQKSLGAQSDAVFAEMKSVHFVFNGSDVTWYGFWFGFGLMASVFLLLSAFVSWQFSNIRPGDWRHVESIAWAFVLANGINAYFSFRYFFVVPGVFATAITALLALGTMRKRTAASSAAS